MFLFLISSCKYDSCLEEVEVLSTIYNSIPKSIPTPPRPIEGSEIDSLIISNINYSKLKSIKFTYAINKNYISNNIEYNHSGFHVPKSKKIFETIIINDTEYQLIKNISKEKDSINKNLFNNKIGSKLIFLDKRVISEKTKKQYRIDGIISFSKVSFNENHNKAAVEVIIYRSGLDSSLSIYILEKVNKKWKIKYYKTPIVS